MEPKSEIMRDRLLSRLPQPENLAEYRQEVSAMLEKNEKGLRRETKWSTVLWVYLTLLATLFLTLSGRLVDKPASAGKIALLGSFSCCMLIWGAVELLKRFINRARVELLKETKQVQLQVLELQAMLRKDGRVGP